MVRFVIYKNSILATICSMFGAACIAMAVGGLVGKEIGILSAMIMIAAGLGLMFLASLISEHKEKKKKAKASARTAGAQASASTLYTGYTQQQANPVYAQPQQTAYIAPAASAASVNQSPICAGIFFLLAAIAGFGAIYANISRISYYMLNSEEVALASMSALLAIAAFRTKHIQQVSVLFVIGFLGLALGSLDATLGTYSSYTRGGQVLDEWVYAEIAMHAFKAAAFFLMSVFALLSNQKIKQRGSSIVRWLWFAPLLLLLLAYSKEIVDNTVLRGMMDRISSRGGWPGLNTLVHPVFLNAYAIVFLTLAVLFSGICFSGLCKKPAVSYQQANYTQPEAQRVYSAPVQETPVQPQSDPLYSVPEQPQAAPQRNDQEIAKQIQAYKDLLDCGILSQAEYDQKMRELM